MFRFHEYMHMIYVHMLNHEREVASPVLRTIELHGPIKLAQWLAWVLLKKSEVGHNVKKCAKYAATIHANINQRYEYEYIYIYIYIFKIHNMYTSVSFACQLKAQPTWCHCPPSVARLSELQRSSTALFRKTIVYLRPTRLCNTDNIYLTSMYKYLTM